MKQPKMTLHGVSICPAGQENYERFEGKPGKFFFQYDYRDTDGELFSTVMPTLTECRMKRDKWLKAKLIRDSKKQEIRQGGKVKMRSTDGVSIPVIFNNLTGQNTEDAGKYASYIENVAIPEMGFQYGDIELIADGKTVATGTIRKTL